MIIDPKHIAYTMPIILYSYIDLLITYMYYNYKVINNLQFNYLVKNKKIKSITKKHNKWVILTHNQKKFCIKKDTFIDKRVDLLWDSNEIVINLDAKTYIIQRSLFFSLAYIFVIIGMKMDCYICKEKNDKTTKENKTTLKNVILPKQTHDDIGDVLSFFNEKEKYINKGVDIPSGYILHGEPGCGKTLVAKAIANELDIDFFAVSGSEFVEKYVGVGAKRVRELFKKARQKKNAIIFIDEIDAVGRKRSKFSESNNTESESTLNQLLVEMDGFDKNKNDETIFVIAATNRIDILDDALIRPGRFDRIIKIQKPDRGCREKLFEMYMKNYKMSEENMEFIVNSSKGMSSAKIKNICMEVNLLSIKEDKEVEFSHFINVLEKE